MDELLFITKFCVTVIAVVALSLIAENISPKTAGILSGYPIGAAISLFFFGIEISPEFASDSALYTLVGLIATQVFVYFYYKASCFFTKQTVLLTSIAAMIFYFAAAFLLHFLKPDKYQAVLMTIVSIGVFFYLFKEIPVTEIENKIKLHPGVFFFRGGMAGASILVITAIAKTAGTTWAGLLSAFPVTLFPLLLIIHITYHKHHVHTIIKHFPLGLGSIICYSVTVSLTYPKYGVWIGTVLSFISATAYLMAYRTAGTLLERVRR